VTLLGHRLDRVNLCAVRAIATLLHAVLAHTRPPAHVLVFEHLIARHPAGKDGGGLLSCCPSALLLNEGRVFFLGGLRTATCLLAPFVARQHIIKRCHVVAHVHLPRNSALSLG